MSFFDFFTAPASAGITGVVNAIGDSAVKLRTAITGDLPPDLKAALETHLTSIEGQLQVAQDEINKAEAGSSSLFVAGWRPSIGWICSIGLFYSFLGQPVLAWASLNFKWTAPPVIDNSALMNLVVAMLGLAGLRTYEKNSGINQVH